MIRYYREEKII